MHLVKFAEDLTLTDTRYFVGEGGDEPAGASDVPVEMTSSEMQIPVPEMAAAGPEDVSDDWGTVIGDDEVAECVPGDEEPEPDAGTVLERAVSEAHQEIVRRSPFRLREKRWMIFFRVFIQLYFQFSKKHEAY